MMHMTMYWGRDMTLVFDWWSTDSWLTYSLSLLAIFLFSLFYQFMEHLRLNFKSLSSSSSSSDRPLPPPTAAIHTPLLSKIGRGHSFRRLAAAAMFGFNSAIGYLLMLAIMSFNGGVLLAVVFGFSVGYYLFRTGIEVDDDSVVVENSCACS